MVPKFKPKTPRHLEGEGFSLFPRTIVGCGRGRNTSDLNLDRLVDLDLVFLDELGGHETGDRDLVLLLEALGVLEARDLDLEAGLDPEVSILSPQVCSDLTI